MKRLPWIVLVASAVLSIAFAALAWIALSSGRVELLLLGAIGLAVQLTVVSTRRAQTQLLAHDWTVIGGVRRLEQRGSELRRRLEAVEQEIADADSRQASTARVVKALRAEDVERYVQVRKHLDALGRRMDALLEAEERRAQEVSVTPPARMEASIEAQTAKTAAQFDWLARNQRHTEGTLADLLAQVERLVDETQGGERSDRQMAAAGEASAR
jgi:hypothetical protein